MGPATALLIFAGLAVTPHAEAMLPLPMETGKATVVLPTPKASSRYLLVVGALGPWQEKTRIRLRSRPTEEKAPSLPWRELPGTIWSADEKLATPCRKSIEPRQSPAPAPTKTIHLFLGGTDLQDPRHYEAVPADLIGYRRRVQAYADRRDLGLPHLAETVRDALEAFEETIGPWVEDHLGPVEDVDRDGRFTLFFSRGLRKLQGTGPPLDGFVRGGDFLRDLEAPLGNRCDLAYLSADLRPGERLRTVLAHEYAHAAVFCARVLGERGEAARRDEESWLHESIAHVVERRLGFSWCNLEHRVAAYLQRPEDYPVVVPDAYGAGLWRCPGVRGAGFLFLDGRARERTDLLVRLTRTSLTGRANLESALGRGFEEAFRAFGVETAVTAWDIRGTDLRYGKGPAPQRFWCGPRPLPLVLNGGEAALDLPGTAQAFFHLYGGEGTGSRLELEAAGDGPLQATLLRLPADLPRLEVGATRTPKGVRVEWRAHHGALRLVAASWAPLPAKGGEERTAAKKDFLGWFPGPVAKSGEVRGGIMELPPAMRDQSVSIRLVARDERGRWTAGWRDLPPAPGPP